MSKEDVNSDEEGKKGEGKEEKIKEDIVSGGKEWPKGAVQG